MANRRVTAVLATLVWIAAISAPADAADVKGGGKSKADVSKFGKLVDGSKKTPPPKPSTEGKKAPPPKPSERTKAPPPKPSSGKPLDVTKSSFRNLEKDGKLTLTSPALDAEGAKESLALSEVLGARLVEQLGKNRKRVEKYTSEPAVDGKRFRGTDSGNLVTRIPTRDGRAESIVLLGPAFATRDLSETLTEVTRKSTPLNNYTALYAGLTDVLAKDPEALAVILKGMPEPAKIGKKNPTKLMRDIVKRWEKTRPKTTTTRGKRDCGQSCEKVVPPSLLVGGKEASSCYERSADGLWATADWTLKGQSTCVKDQGETRGTGVAFAISAAMEMAVRREHDQCLDLSEQHLHFQQKNHWFPVPPNFGDDLNSPTSVFGMMVGDYEFRAEDQWHYNLSPNRKETTLKSKAAGIYQTYKDSCVGYSDSPCSETNHQGQLLCAKGTKECGYTAQIPPPKEAVKVLAYNSFFNVNLPGPTADLAPVFLAFGAPVVVSFQVSQSFLDAADDGWVRPVSSGKGNQRKKIAADPLRGWHVAVLEGYVRNQDLAKGTPAAAGGGYFVMKNSWGPCVGDGGYWYVPKQWMVDHALSMTALTGFEAFGESSVTGLYFNSANPPEGPVYYSTHDNQAFVAGYSTLPWSDGNAPSTTYYVCITSSETSTDCGDGSENLFWVPSDQAAQKMFRAPASIVYAPQYRGKTVTWRVVACNGVGCTWANTVQTARFALPNARLYLPLPNQTTSRTPTVYWHEVEGATSYKVVFGPSPLPAPDPPSNDFEFKKYPTQGTNAGNGTRSFTVPADDPIPQFNDSNTVHWYVEACRNIGNNNICSLWPYWENRPSMLHEGVFYFGTLNLEGEGGAPPAGMTFDEACSIIRDLVDSPRCRNCHAAYSDVTRGNAMSIHGGLSPTTVCANCHNDSPTSSRPWPGPGEPIWHAPSDVGMHWTGLTPDQIVERIADPATNGGRSLDQIAAHVQTDHLVLWGFNPVGGNGETNGRTPAPHELTYVEAFLVWADQWVNNGSTCD